MVKALGAVPVAVSPADAYAALQKGAVGAYIAPIENGLRGHVLLLAFSIKTANQ